MPTLLRLKPENKHCLNGSVPTGHIWIALLKKKYTNSNWRKVTKWWFNKMRSLIYFFFQVMRSIGIGMSVYIALYYFSSFFHFWNTGSSLLNLADSFPIIRRNEWQVYNGSHYLGLEAMKEMQFSACSPAQRLLTAWYHMTIFSYSLIYSVEPYPPHRTMVHL